MTNTTPPDAPKHDAAKLLEGTTPGPHRYSLIRDPEYSSQMLVRPDGRYVLHADHAAQVAALTAENEALRDAAKDAIWGMHMVVDTGFIEMREDRTIYPATFYDDFRRAMQVALVALAKGGRP